MINDLRYCLLSLQDTPLHIAAQRGDLEVAKALLANGADVNAQEAKVLALLASTIYAFYA